MPIGDLLASISGGSGTASPIPASKPLPQRVSVPKRKADDDLRRDTPKTPRPEGTKPSQPTRPLEKNNASSTRPYNGNARSVPAPAKVSTDRVTKPSNPGRPAGSGPSASRASVAPAAPVRAPKKGSFADILARAGKAQETMGQVGRIQHKKVEGGMLKKEKVAARGEKPGSSVPIRKGVSGYSGSAQAGASRNGTSNTMRSRPQAPAPKPVNTAEARKAAKEAAKEEEARKRKEEKLAKFNSGYGGTSRVKPAESSRPKHREPPRGGALLQAPKARSGGSRNSRYDQDDYDEELDDFIDYDDEEDDGRGPRYEYASDGSSDMEAGMDDVFEEESRAERIARQEDLEEQRLEERLKANKEQRKRQAALEELRARRR